MVGMGAGMAMGQQMANSMNNIQQTPPALPNKIAQYYLAIEEKADGPYSLEVVENYLQSGKINKDTLLWTQGMQNWEKTSTVLGKNFTQLPPPLK